MMGGGMYAFASTSTIGFSTTTSKLQNQNKRFITNSSSESFGEIMTPNISDGELAETTRNQLTNQWTVHQRANQLTVQADNIPAQARIEPQQDGSLIVTGYVETEWNGSNKTPVLDFYCTSTDEESVVNELVEFCQTHEELGDTVWPDDANVASVETAVESIKESDAVFAAIPEDYLARGLFGIIYHVPAGGDDAGVADALREFDAVEIDGKPHPIRLSSVLAAEAHLYRRVPLYAEETGYGPAEVTVEDGIRQVSQFVKNDEDPTPLPSESVTPDRLTEKLVETGAVAIAVEPEISSEDTLTLSVWVPDATAYEVVGQYETINVDGTLFDLNWEFRCIDGPNFLGRVPIYASDNIIGMEPVSVDDGVSNIEEYVTSGCPRSVVDTQWGGKR